MRRVSASAAGGATRTANGARRPRTSPNWCRASATSWPAPRVSSDPGGRLVYATCSLLREENEAQAEAFLAAHPDFALLPAARAWAETIGGESPGGDDYLRLTPARHGTDGFFVAIFERRAST